MAIDSTPNKSQLHVLEEPTLRRSDLFVTVCGTEFSSGSPIRANC